jgi:hypothetical protein
MLDEKYILQEKERLLQKYKCQTVAELIQLLEKILENKQKNTESAEKTPQVG